MISNKAIKAISESHTLQGMLADAFKKHIVTVQRWTETNSKMLSTEMAVQVIKNQTGMSEDEILNTEEAIK